MNACLYNTCMKYCRPEKGFDPLGSKVTDSCKQSSRYVK